MRSTSMVSLDISNLGFIGAQVLVLPVEGWGG